MGVFHNVVERYREAKPLGVCVYTAISFILPNLLFFVFYLTVFGLNASQGTAYYAFYWLYVCFIIIGHWSMSKMISKNTPHDTSYIVGCVLASPFLLIMMVIMLVPEGNRFDVDYELYNAFGWALFNPEQVIPMN